MMCIETTAPLNTNGYGQTKVTIAAGHRTQILAHRLVFEQAWDITVPDDRIVRHTCDNSRCINPLHLQLGTQRDNVMDAINRGRRTPNHMQYMSALRWRESDDN